MIKRLTVRSRDNIEQVADILWIDGVLTVTTPSNGVRDDFNRIIKHGLREIIGDPADPVPRTTPATDEYFIDRLAAYLRRQFGFIIQVTNERET